jgi:tetratricopeptide (TPR) repeat protein
MLLCLVFAAASLSAQWNTRNMLQMGKNAIYFDDYISAIDNFNSIIRLKPYLSEPYFFRGLAKMNLEDHEGAIQDYTHAIELNPNYFHAYMYRGISLHNQGKYSEALKDYDEAVSLSPDDAYVYANRGITRAETGDYAGAEKDYSQSLLINNQLLAAYLNRAIMREKLDNVEGAIADCNAAIRLNMFSDDAYGLRGYLWYRQKEYHNAVEDFNRALKANPENKRIRMSRAMVWYDLKKYREVLDDYTEIIRLDSNYLYAWYNRGLLRAEIGEYNNAIADLDKVVEINPDNILVYFNRGLLKIEINDLPGAYADFSESIRLYPDFAKAYLVRAVVSDRLQNYGSAERDRYLAQEVLERYRKMKEGDRNALVDTAENFRRLVDFSAREDRMRDVINGRIQNRNVIIELQDIFIVQYLSTDSLRSGKVQYYNRHLMEYNQRQNYRNALTLSNRKFHYPEEFIRQNIAEFSEAIHSGEGKRDACLLRGIFYMNNREYPRALEDFAAVLQAEPDYLLALFNEANARMQMYDYIESVGGPDVRVIGGEAEKTQEKRKVDYTQVLEGYRKCLEIDPDFIYALFNTGNVYVKNEQIDQAIETYGRVIEADRDFAEAYFNRGLLYVYTGKRVEANADLSKAGELGIVEAYNVIKRYCREESE